MRIQPAPLDAPSRDFVSRVARTVYPRKGALAAMIALSLVLSASYVAVYWMDGTTKAECFWVFWGLAGVMFVLLSFLAYEMKARQIEGGRQDVSKKHWLFCFGVLFVSYAVTLAANFPGTLSTDSYASIEIALGNAPLSNAHPLFYTALVTPFAQLGEASGNMDLGVFLFSLVQMTAFAAICSYACFWLKKRSLPDIAVLAALAFFAFNPVVAKYASTMWKDIPFALCMLLALLQLLDIALSKGEALESRKTRLKLAAIVLLVCLLRNNGIYAMALLAVFMAFVWHRHVKGIASVFTAIIVAYVITGPVYGLLDVEPSPFRESVGIPIQQISAVVAQDGDVTEDQLETLSELVDPEAVREFYDPTSSNPVKYHESFDNDWLNTHQSEFLKLWADVGMQNPVAYLQAWMRATQGYWNMETHAWVVSEGGRNLLYEATGLALLNGSPTTQFTELRSSSPVSLLFNMGFALWATVLIALTRWIGKQRDLCIPLIMYIGLWGTMLIAAPYYAEFRYMFPLHLALPVVLATAFLKTPEEKLPTRTSEAEASGAKLSASSPNGPSETGLPANLSSEAAQAAEAQPNR